jgi:hypothetical protein
METPAEIEVLRLIGIGGDRSGGRDRDEPRSDKRGRPKHTETARDKSKTRESMSSRRSADGVGHGAH